MIQVELSVELIQVELSVELIQVELPVELIQVELPVGLIHFELPVQLPSPSSRLIEPRSSAELIDDEPNLPRSSAERASVSSLPIELTEPSSSCAASRSFSADNLRIMALIARALGELEPSVAADDDDDFELLPCFLLQFSP